LPFGERRNDDFRKRVVEVVSAGAFGFIRPDDDGRMARLIDRRSHDLRDHDGAEAVHLGTLLEVGTSGEAHVRTRVRAAVVVIGEGGGQRGVAVVELVRGDHAILRLGIAVQVPVNCSSAR